MTNVATEVWHILREIGEDEWLRSENHDSDDAGCDIGPLDISWSRRVSAARKSEKFWSELLPEAGVRSLRFSPSSSISSILELKSTSFHHFPNATSSFMHVFLAYFRSLPPMFPTYSSNPIRIPHPKIPPNIFHCAAQAWVSPT